MNKLFTFLYPIIISLIFICPAIHAEIYIMLVRHGQTDLNKERRVQGIGDGPLNEEGRSQAQQFADSFGFTPDAIYSSDLQRAVMTAQPLAERYGLAIHQSADFRELDFGILEGQKIDCELTNGYRHEHSLIEDRQTKWNTPIAPEAETEDNLLSRFKRAFIEIAMEYPDNKVVVFTHGKAISVVMSSLGNDEDALRIGNCQAITLGIDLEHSEDPTPNLKISLK